MYQSWHSLTFLHWRFDPAVVQKLLPEGLTVDTWEGEAYVGLVPFKMVNVRFARGYSVIGARDFPETNVRTYVIGPNGDPAVWFFSLDAASPHAAAGGRILYGLPYHFASMNVAVSADEVSYQSRRRQAECAIATALPPEFSAAAPGTRDFWLVERYLLFARRRGRLWSGQVHHPPYPVAPVQAVVRQNTMLSRLGFEAKGEPIAHYSPGVDVELFRLKPA
jgi:uncharacterized protein YqjF (DUF2071 family)